MLLGLWYFVFLFSLVVHEASHAWASMKLGDDTAYEGGQVTLDPRPHIQREPLGTVAVPLITYFLNGWMMGWGSAPCDPHWRLNYPKLSAFVSLAGPLANLGIVLITGIIIRVGVAFDIFFPPDYMNFTTIVSAHEGGIVYSFSILLSIMFSLNVVLFAFNLFPLPPLDGSGIIPLFFRREEDAVRYLHFIHNPAFSMLGILLAWRIGDFILGPIHTAFVNGLYWGLMHY